MFYKIEELLLIGEEKIELAHLYVRLLVSVLSFESVLIIWREECTYANDIKSLLKFNNLKLKTDLEFFVKSKYTIRECLEFTYKKISENYSNYESISKMNNYTEKINKIFETIILMLLKDERKIEPTPKMKEKLNDQINQSYPLMKQMIIETINTSYNYRHSFEEFGNIFGGDNIHNRCTIQDLENLASSFMFPLINHMINKNIMIFDNVNIEPWIKRTEPKTWFCNEIGIGGTISHVLKEFGEKVEGNKSLKNEECDFNSEIHHRLMKLSYTFLSELYKNYSDINLKFGRADIQLLNIREHGSESLYNIIRPLYGVFNLKNQQLLYAYSFFLLDMFSKFKNTQPEVIYFIPKFVMDIPLLCFNILRLLNSPVLKDNSINSEITIRLSILQSKDYLLRVLVFYTDIIRDDRINNPEIIESLLKSINSFVSDPTTYELYIKNKNLLTSLITGVIRFLNNETLNALASKILFFIIMPACRDSDFKKEIKDSVANAIKLCFNEQKEFYHLFLDAYSQMLNKSLTGYTLYLDDLTKQSVKINTYGSDPSQIKTYFKIWETSVKAFNENLMLYQAIINTSPEVLDVKSLTFSRMNFLLGSLTTRIIAQPYLNEGIKFCKEYYSDQMNNLLMNIITIFDCLVKRLEEEMYKLEGENRELYEEFFLKGCAKQDVNYSTIKEVLDHLCSIFEYENKIKDIKDHIIAFSNKVINKSKKLEDELKVSLIN